MSDLWAALCLVAVIEGLLLFALPRIWRDNAEYMLKMPDRQLRTIGGVVLVVGVLALYAVRG
ncbi:DUF2065 domain-containing protein [Luteimonas abyssi]|uniref:DUF2065 domain-containing protein n=1 Tax=Luteimonas abyssi TaxID=1247514 RepID=UPI000737ACAC|nr:DUF2065 domain-containing protein [Luteimonas abyssi]